MKQDILDKVRSINCTLQLIEIRSTMDNLDRMLGCLMELKNIERLLTEPAQNHETKRTEEWNNV